MQNCNEEPEWVNSELASAAIRGIRCSRQRVFRAANRQGAQATRVPLPRGRPRQAAKDARQLNLLWKDF
jgi:hypothetical protein